MILSFSFSFYFYQWLYLWHRGYSVSLISSDILTWVDKEIEVVDEIRSSISLRKFPFSIRSCTNRVTMMIEVWWYFEKHLRCISISIFYFSRLQTFAEVSRNFLFSHFLCSKNKIIMQFIAHAARVLHVIDHNSWDFSGTASY